MGREESEEVRLVDGRDRITMAEPRRRPSRGLDRCSFLKRSADVNRSLRAAVIGSVMLRLAALGLAAEKKPKPGTLDRYVGVRLSRWPSRGHEFYALPRTEPGDRDRDRVIAPRLDRTHLGQLQEEHTRNPHRHRRA